MFDKSEFYRELGKYLGVPERIEITSVDDSCYYQEGCPTCGGTYEFTVDVYGTDPDKKGKNKRYCESFDGRLSDFLASLD